MIRADLLAAEEEARRLARFLGDQMPRGWGFFLCLSSFGDDRFTTYISSVERDCAAAMMVEILEKWKQDPELWANVTREVLKAKERKESDELRTGTDQG